VLCASFAAMTSDSSIVAEAEAFLRACSKQLTDPYEHECLCCYVARMLGEFPCDGTHRHALRFRDARAPRATALRDRLSRVGACCCDCELFLNGYRLPAWLDAYDDEVDEAEPAGDPLPPCAGVRRGSVRPCSNWVRVRRR
jgi:hypothetical protein